NRPAPELQPDCTRGRTAWITGGAAPASATGRPDHGHNRHRGGPRVRHRRGYPVWAADLESTRANDTACRAARGRSGGFVVPGRVRVTRPGVGGAGRSGREPVDDRDTGPRYQPAQPVAVRVTVIATARAAGR